MAGALLRTLYVEQQVAVYRERPGLGGSQRLQLVGGLPGLCHVGDQHLMAVVHGLDRAHGDSGQIRLQLGAVRMQGVRVPICMAVEVSYWWGTPMASL